MSSKYNKYKLENVKFKLRGNTETHVHTKSHNNKRESSKCARAQIVVDIAKKLLTANNAPNCIPCYPLKRGYCMYYLN